MRWKHGLNLGVMLLVVWAAGAEAATVTFSTTLRGERQNATVELTNRDGVTHVHLDSVMQQLGGGFRVEEGYVQFDLVGSSARLASGGVDVNASLAQFKLKHPLTVSADTVLMALIDVVPFFKQAFGLEMRQALSSQPEAMPEDVPEALPLEIEKQPVAVTELEDPGLLEPITLTDKPQQVAVRRPIERIVLDAGHGGNDFGSEGRNVNEKDLCLAVARLVAQSLRVSLKKEVFLTRAGDINLPLKGRVGVANSHQGDLFVSIHGAASLSNAPHGFAAFFPPAQPAAAPSAESQLTWTEGQDYAPQSKEIAEAICTAVQEAAQNTDRGAREADCRVFRDLRMPAVLVELGFLTHGDEEALLANKEYQGKLAQGIAAGIVRCAAAAPKREVTP